MSEEGKFYRVAANIKGAPVRDHLFHGFEERQDFERALRRLVRRWHDRIGEAVSEHNGFLLLRFHDTHGGLPDEAWIPLFLLSEVPRPANLYPSFLQDEAEEELDRAFGFG